jgi:Plasmid pRiA4b ORF-3-like protein
MAGGSGEALLYPQARAAAVVELEASICQICGMTNRTTQSDASDSFNEIATVRIELRHTDPLIWRQVEVPSSITFKVLHDIIQAVMGWFDYHLWEFTVSKQRYGLPMDDDWGPCHALMPAKRVCAMR